MTAKTQDEVRRFAGAAIVFTIAIALRWRGTMPPFDDLYHWKRIAWSAAHWPRVLAFDPDRGFAGAFCPWPPLYDLACATLAKLTGLAAVEWFPPIGFALFAGAVALRFGIVAGVGIAFSPYLVPIASRGAIDHHWTEPALVLLIALAASRPRIDVAWLTAAIVAALMVQTALLVAVALAFAAVFFFGPLDPTAAPGVRTADNNRVRAALAFAIAATVIALYRLTRPDGYPANAWFLGWPHVAALCAAAVALFARAKRLPPLVALAAGGACMLPVIPSVILGSRFFGGDPWLESITEFQPMFHDPAAIGTELANLSGGALLAFLVFRRHRLLGLFSIIYLLLSLTSHRFLVPGIPLFMICGAVAASEAKTKRMAIAAALLTLVPPIAYDLYAFAQPAAPEMEDMRAVAAIVAPLPPGRVLAPWAAGHAIDVLGRHPVVIDNFGSMPDEATFTEASRALLATRDDDLTRWCRAHDVRYVVFTRRERIHGAAAAIGATVDPRRTVWWRRTASMTKTQQAVVMEIR